jgi:aminopeptidase N
VPGVVTVIVTPACWFLLGYGSGGLAAGLLIPYLRKGLLLVAPNLTREEAGERAALVKVISYQVDLDLTGGEGTFGSQSVVRFSCAVPGAGTFVDLVAVAVSRITLNGEPVPPAAFDGERITLAGLAAENVLVVHAECAYSRSGEGLHRFTDPADGNIYLYSNLETSDAQRLYASLTSLT